MSYWTHVNGIIKVSSLGFNTQSESDYAVAKAVEKLPKVTGSERNMTITIVPIDNVTSSCWDEDCKEDVEVKEEYYLIVHGNLRDRKFDQTFREFCKMMNRLAKRIWVQKTLVEIDGWSKKYILSDNSFYGGLSN